MRSKISMYAPWVNEWRILGGKRTSSNGYESQVTYYQAKNCQGCPLRTSCHKAKGNRRIEVNHRLNFLKQQAKEKLMNEKGLEHRSKRPIEAEAAFGQLKSNNKFTRFTLTGLDKDELEFLLMAIGHNLRKMVAKSIRPELNSYIKSAFVYINYNCKLVFYVSKEKAYQKSPIMTLDFQNQKMAA